MAKEKNISTKAIMALVDVFFSDALNSFDKFKILSVCFVSVETCVRRSHWLEFSIWQNMQLNALRAIHDLLRLAHLLAGMMAQLLGLS